MDWKCVLYTESVHHFSRVLEKGGAHVLLPSEVCQGEGWVWDAELPTPVGTYLPPWVPSP